MPAQKNNIWPGEVVPLGLVVYHSSWLANNVQISDLAPQMCRLQTCRSAEQQMCRCATAYVQMSPEPTTKDAAPTTKNALNPWYQHFLAAGHQFAEQHQTAQQPYRCWPAVAGPWPRNCSLIAVQWQCPHKSKIGKTSSLQSDRFELLKWVQDQKMFQNDFNSVKNYDKKLLDFIDPK